MRYLLTTLLCVFTLSLTAQVDCLGPDFNNDGVVGAADILVFLTYYGDEWPLVPEFVCGETIAHQDYAYSTVQIGDQCWFSENCRYLPTVSDSNTSSFGYPHYYVFGYEGTDVTAAMATANYETYGVLYNWPAVMTEGICPSGWHIPSDEEWQTLEISLGMSEADASSYGMRGSPVGDYLKSTSGWYDGGNGSNTSGFTGLPGGNRWSNSFYYDEIYGYWWTTSASPGAEAWIRLLYNNGSDVWRYDEDRDNGYSARCLEGPSTAETQGCMDDTACNYDSNAITDDGSCILVGYTCDDDDVNTSGDEIQSDCSCVGTPLTLFENCGDEISHYNYNYSTVQIGTQCWFSENCRYLPEGADLHPYNKSETVPYYYVNEYQNSSDSGAQQTSNYQEYGVLYNWPAVMTEGICPSGWHIPSDDEWQTLEMELGMSEADAASEGWRGTDQAVQMKSTSGWYDGGNGSNSSGFMALPGGVYSSYNFYGLPYFAAWWSATEYLDYGFNSWIRILYHDTDSVNRTHDVRSSGLSARCIQTLEIPGCIDDTACNYDSTATQDDDSCEFFSCPGCNDPSAINYNPSSLNNEACYYCVGLVTHDGYDYSIVQIGEQCWFAENCRYLPSVSSSSVGSETSPYYYVYNYEGTDVAAAQATTNYETYGVLYNWPAVVTEGICPNGWHIPSDGEWQIMEMSLGMSEADASSTGWRGAPVGDYLKSTFGWNNNGNGSNLSGFTGLPGGFMYSGGFLHSGDYGYWWSSSEFDSDSWKRSLNYNHDDVTRDDYSRDSGFSARCVRD
ncbi:MAG: hypothetical protein HOM41_02285 [Flavobacteriales bacterium]|nr:hypothetical protein [Flavobacteriales bacterium]